MKRNKILIIIATAVILIIAAVSLILLFNKNKTVEIKDIVLNDKLEFEINSEVYNTDLINVDETIKNGFVTITEEELIDTKKLGKNTYSYGFKDKENNDIIKEITYIIKDSTKPEITISNDIVETIKGNEIDLLSNASCKDNSEEEINIEIIGDYDFNSIGEYELKYSAKDSSGNISEKEFKLIIKEEVKETKANSKTNNSTSKKNNASNNSNNYNNSNYYEEPTVDSDEAYERAKQATIAKKNELKGKFFTYDPGMTGIEGHGYIESMSANFWWEYSGGSWYVNNDCNNPLGMPNTQSASSFLGTKPSQDGEYAGQISGNKVRLYWVSGHGID